MLDLGCYSWCPMIVVSNVVLAWEVLVAKSPDFAGRDMSKVSHLINAGVQHRLHLRHGAAVAVAPARSAARPTRPCPSFCASTFPWRRHEAHGERHGGNGEETWWRSGWTYGFHPASHRLLYISSLLHREFQRRGPLLSLIRSSSSLFFCFSFLWNISYFVYIFFQFFIF